MSAFVLHENLFISGSKSGTGTVIIQVEDVNDNLPEIPTSELVLCEKQGELGSVVVVAEDKDQPPFSSPFTFSLPKDNDGKWSVTRFNGRFFTIALYVWWRKCLIKYLDTLFQHHM